MPASVGGIIRMKVLAGIEWYQTGYREGIGRVWRGELALNSVEQVTFCLFCTNFLVWPGYFLVA